MSPNGLPKVMSMSTNVFLFSHFSLVPPPPMMLPQGLETISHGLLRDPKPGGGKPAPPAVWEAYKARGFATFLAEEMHDGCGDHRIPKDHVLELPDCAYGGWRATF